MSKKAVIGEPAPAVEKGDGGHADWVNVAVHCLREYLDQPYRQLLDILQEMPGIVTKLGLLVDELSDFTTICTRNQDLEMRIWRVLLRLTARLHESGEIQVIDSTSLAQRTSSHNYAKCVEDTLELVKTTRLVDCDSGAILDVHCAMTLPHDTQVAWQLLTRNPHQLDMVVADKGFGWDEPRHKLRDEGIRPVIKHQEFYSPDAAHNVRIDDDTYHRRSIVEAIFFLLRKRFGETTRARTWFGQFEISS